jgi:hypothetical protein
MPMITVHKYKTYNFTQPGEWVVSRRMATCEFIAKVKATKIENTSVEIDSSLVDSNGQTQLDFVATSRP